MDRIIERKILLRENIFLKKRLKERYRYGDIIGVSSQMQELVAKTIHQKSNRKNKPFVPVYCGAIVETLLESELFGHRKGAFSGAIKDNIGLFRAAEGGTIFLDEIAEISHPVQLKLLRTLQEKKVRPVGNTKEIGVDVRVIAATNRGVRGCYKKWSLKEGSLLSLKRHPHSHTPLRERKEDIPILVNHFVDVFNNKGISIAFL